MSRKRKPMKGINQYGFKLTDEQIAAGEHRGRVGRGWERTGKLLKEFLIARGMQPSSKLLDVGCGAARAGIVIAPYLEPGNYYGIDINESLIRAAREFELPQAGLQDRVPASNLRVSERFECDFGVSFDFAIAQSVFTHLPLNHIRLCLYQVAQVMAPGGRFYASFFEAPDGTPYHEPVKQVVRTTKPERDPFHYRRDDLRWAAQSVSDWEVRYVGPWRHRRGQQMMEYTYSLGSVRRESLAGERVADARAAALRVRGRLARPATGEVDRGLEDD